MQYLFSADGRQAIADGIITLDQYCLIPSDAQERVITAIADPETRERLINHDLTIHDIIGEAIHHDVTPVVINAGQSTHTASVHRTVSESAIRLLERYRDKVYP